MSDPFDANEDGLENPSPAGESSVAETAGPPDVDPWAVSPPSPSPRGPSGTPSSPHLPPGMPPPPAPFQGSPVFTAAPEASPSPGLGDPIFAEVPPYSPTSDADPDFVTHAEALRGPPVGYSAPPPPKSRKGPVVLLGLFAISAIVALGAIWFINNDDAQTATITTLAPLEAQTAEATPVVELQPANIYDGVALIAENVGPAVVQLDTNFGLGSGVIYDETGYILTAAHVIEGARTVKVRLADGRLFDGEIVGSHVPTDIAVVKIDGPDLPVAELATGVDTRVGALAVALGSPFGLDQSVTAGIVSAVDREISGVPMVQTDAAINPGNSGGPLVDGAGRVIGINDQIFTNSGGNEGIGFAVSIDLAKLVADQLVDGGDVQLSFLGVSSTTSDVNRAGALVQEVVSESAAELAGLEIGDLIIAVDGDRIASAADLRVNIINTAPGTEITLDILRNGEPTTLTAVLGRS